MVGSRRAQAHLRSTTASSSHSSSSRPAPSDPWHNGHDPWAKFAATSAPVAAPNTKRIEALATQLRADVAADVTASVQEQLATSVPGASGGPDQQRIQRLEVGMAELQAHQQQFHTWFSETGNKLAAQDDQLQMVKNQLQVQQAEITAVRAEVHTSAETLHQAMQVSFQSMKADISNDLTSAINMQMDRFETMLTAKKSRTE